MDKYYLQYEVCKNCRHFSSLYIQMNLKITRLEINGTKLCGFYCDGLNRFTFLFINEDIIEYLNKKGDITYVCRLRENMAKVLNSIEINDVLPCYTEHKLASWNKQ